jgi:putative endopeptidase
MRYGLLLITLGVFMVAFTGLAQNGQRSGLDASDFDRSIRPQDDMFRHVNGGWLTRTTNPADRAVYGTFVEIADRTETDLRVLIEALAAAPQPASGTTQQVGVLYRSFMDEAGVERVGLTPLRERIAAVDGLSDSTQLATLLGRLSM